MPRVPTVTNQSVESRGIPSARVADQSLNLGGAIQSLTGAARGLQQQFAREAQVERDRADNAAVIEAETGLDNYENTALFDPQAGAFTRKGKNAFDLPNQVLPAYDAEVKRIEDGLGSDRAKQAFKQRAARRRAGIGQQLNRYESQQRDVYYDEQDLAGLKSSQGVAANYFSEPARISEELAKQDAIIDARGARKGLSAEQVQEAKRASRSGTHTDVVQRFFSTGDYAGGGKYFEANREQIGSDDATRIESALSIERRRAAEQAQRDADRREAKAERTLAEVDRQIASGIPATPEMWKRWADTTAGTSFEGEYKGRLADERAVQDLLGKPIDEQIRYIQDKESALATGGGSLRELANVNRLKGAVQQNLALLQQNPLLFDERRSGASFTPLDLNNLGSFDSVNQIRDRADALKSLQSRYGASVPLKPLLPQEAQQITGVLQSVTPQRQAEILSGLYEGLQDPKVFQGAMQQIAPDAPVKALAGILAGKETEVVTKRRFFGANETQTAQNVARTLLEGDAILNASPSDKKQDGNPKVGLYLPETSLLQLEFTDLVGDAFRGREGAAQLAFQAVKSYYVGKAAQTGRIAASKEDVDTSLVRESVTAVLGAVSDYNGAGKVLAPWGMDQSTFEDRAESAFRLEATRRGIPKGRIEDLNGDIGLQNAGDNRYRVTIGKNFLTDSLGDPIVINLDDLPEAYVTPKVLR